MTIAHRLRDTFIAHSVGVELVKTHVGAAVDLIEFEVLGGTKVAKIRAMADDLALAVGVSSVRILAPIPGTTHIGVEVPSSSRDVLEYAVVRADHQTPLRHHDVGALPFPVGQQVGNGVIWADLAATPHLLIAGATGSGKSVALNTILTSLLDFCDAHQVRIHLIDPKRVELGAFRTAPQVASFDITVESAVDTLDDLVDEMDRRYDLFEEAKVRNITEYNASTQFDARDIRENGGESRRYLPFHVLVIDELADLIGKAKEQVEPQIQRLTQLARAAGIHLIVATQRPSVDVITGVIKGNIPSRWAFTVASGVDSKVVLDSTGAEALYGKGDSLWSGYGSLDPVRVQAVYTSDEEVRRAVEQSIERHEGTTTLSSVAGLRAAEEDDEIEIPGLEPVLPESVLATPNTVHQVEGRDPLFEALEAAEAQQRAEARQYELDNRLVIHTDFEGLHDGKPIVLRTPDDDIVFHPRDFRPAVADLQIHADAQGFIEQAHTADAFLESIYRLTEDRASERKAWRNLTVCFASIVGSCTIIAAVIVR